MVEPVHPRRKRLLAAHPPHARTGNPWVDRRKAAGRPPPHHHRRVCIGCRARAGLARRAHPRPPPQLCLARASAAGDDPVAAMIGEAASCHAGHPEHRPTYAHLARETERVVAAARSRCQRAVARSSRPAARRAGVREGRRAVNYSASLAAGWFARINYTACRPSPRRRPGRCRRTMLVCRPWRRSPSSVVARLGGPSGRQVLWMSCMAQGACRSWHEAHHRAASATACRRSGGRSPPPRRPHRSPARARRRGPLGRA